MSNKINFIMSEFDGNGNNRTINIDRLNPSFKSFNNYFSNAKFILYTNFNLEHDIENLEVKKVKMPKFIKNKRQRRGYIAHDYFQFKGLYESNTNLSIAIDNDLKIYSDEVKTIIPITKKVGMCMAISPRGLIKEVAAHSKLHYYDIKNDCAKGNSTILSTAFISLYKNSQSKLKLIKNFINNGEKDNEPNVIRNGLRIGTSIKETGIYPYVLSPNWCVCKQHVGIGNEIINHVGHGKVSNYYN